jgi:predicted DNA-binding transcriptional regulator AlpA
MSYNGHPGPHPPARQAATHTGARRPPIPGDDHHAAATLELDDRHCAFCTGVESGPARRFDAEVEDAVSAKDEQTDYVLPAHHVRLESESPMASNLRTLEEVSEMTRTPAATLQFWRHKGTGPKSFKVGRRVMYREEDVAAWLKAQYAGLTEFHGGDSAQ